MQLKEKAKKDLAATERVQKNYLLIKGDGVASGDNFTDEELVYFNFRFVVCSVYSFLLGLFYIFFVCVYVCDFGNCSPPLKIL